MEDKTCRIMIKFMKENKMVSFFKRKITALEKVKELLAKFSQ